MLRVCKLGDCRIELTFKGDVLNFQKLFVNPPKSLSYVYYCHVFLSGHPSRPSVPTQMQHCRLFAVLHSHA